MRVGKSSFSNLIYQGKKHKVVFMYYIFYFFFPLVS